MSEVCGGGMVQSILESSKISNFNTMWFALQLDNASGGVRVDSEINTNEEFFEKAFLAKARHAQRPKGKSEQQSCLGGV